jgi:tRNA A37 threonylcarbamoyladenosine dehydratase
MELSNQVAGCDPVWWQRTELLLGAGALERLRRAHVLVAGLGGVGAYAAEQLCRAGVGELTLVDGDRVEPSNKNRQLPALDSTLGEFKTDVMAARFRDINPEVTLHLYPEYVKDDRVIEVLGAARYDYVIDAIDTLSPKVFLIYHATREGYPLVSAMGAGGKLDPSLVRVADISLSYNCRLARALRKRLHRLGARAGFPVVFSPEEVAPSAVLRAGERDKKSTVGTVSYMPALFGCLCASVAIRGLARG